MSLYINGTLIGNVICNGITLNNVICNGVEVWKKTNFIDNGVLASGVSMSVIYESCSAGEWTTGVTQISGTTITNSCSDYNQTSRSYVSRVRFDGLSFVGKGQTVSITNTYYNKQVSEGYDRVSNFARLYTYNLSTGAIYDLGNIRTDGTKTFALPDDGQTYTLCVGLSTYASLPNEMNISNLSISQLYVN